MNTLAERVRRALDEMDGASASGLARACGIKPASVAGWLNGSTKTLKASTAYAAAEYLGVCLPWLAEGKGPMRTWLAPAHPHPAPAASAQALPPDEQALLDLYRGLTDDQRSELVRSAEATKQLNEAIYARLSAQKKKA